MNLKSRIEALVLLLIVSAGAEAGVAGRAETVSCSSPWGGVNGNCQMTKVVEQVIGGVGGVTSDWDRLKWNCKVTRDGNVEVASETRTDSVPSRDPGARWSRTITVKSGQQLPQREYCTRNRSHFYYRSNGPGFRIISGAFANGVDLEHCLTTPPQNGGGGGGGGGFIY